MEAKIREKLLTIILILITIFTILSIIHEIYMIRIEHQKLVYNEKIIEITQNNMSDYIKEVK